MNDPNDSAARRLLRNAYRELTVCVIVWLVALLWTLGCCLLMGYQHPPDSWVVRSGWARNPAAQDVAIWFGFPDWVLLGIIVPWVVATLFTVVYCLCWMPDDDLGHDEESVP